ncbi:MAG: gliding motility-associated C-terminal domain-containing protein [Bacteroidales bacterium]|nr:gliding motility-associated C-terminal domain-containing protein [Bacteroidales bacterium]
MNNYSGDWENPSSWEPVWDAPETNILSSNIIINGFIRCGSSVTINGNSSYLSINDTLVIYGDLTIGNNNSLYVNSGAILIIYGNLVSENKATIAVNQDAYIVISGNFSKLGTVTYGTFISNDIPSNVFVTGTLSDSLDTDLYPVFSCPGTSPYPNSGCSYGNLEDLKNETVYDLIQTTCLIPDPVIKISGNLSFCEGDSVVLTASHGESYLWSTGEKTQRINVSSSGYFSVIVYDSIGCKSKSSTEVETTENPLPDAKITIIENSGITDNDGVICNGHSATLIAEGGDYYQWTTGETLSEIQTGTEGSYSVAVTDRNGCSDSASAELAVIQINAFAGDDQVLEGIGTTGLQGQLTGPGTGTWSFSSGYGTFEDDSSPVSQVSGLSSGENVLLWTVTWQNCTVSDTMVITVHNLFIPQVITPNGDGKNDFFVINGIENHSPAELVIINRWGIEQFRSTDYTNNWDGKNQKGTELPGDSYFYILKLANGSVHKGFLLIKVK